MNSVLKLSAAIDALSRSFGWIAEYAVLACCLISAGNAASRYLFSYSSNALLEIQWYLFAAIFLLSAGYALLKNAHVRIDIVSARLSDRARAWIDIVGGLLFLLPMTVLILYFSWPMFVQSYVTHELSSDAGGLVRWYVKALIPAGFGLLALQGFSEIVKRIAILRDELAAQDLRSH